MKSILSAAILILSVLSISAEQARYDNYRVYNIAVNDDVQLKVLKELSVISDSYNFWSSPTSVGTNVELIVPPHQFAHFGELVEKFNLQVTLTNSNLQELIDNERPKRQRKLADGEINWTDYHRYQDIYDWIDALAIEFPGTVTVEQIGYTYEGRPLKIVKLSKQQNNRVIFIEAGIHAREWIAPATATYLLDQLLRSNDPVIMDMAQNIDWYIVPITNPDGYEYTHTINRNWRKSRSPVSLVCYGVDQNRNWGFNWLVPDETGDEGGSRVPCSDTYSGSSPFSENETLAIEDYLTPIAGRVDIFLALHSYGHQFLHPFGHTRVRAPNFDVLQDLGNAAAAAIQALEGVQYDVGSSNEINYATSGSSRDHAYGKHNIPVSYTIEQRGNGGAIYGNHGFFLPPQYIIPNCLEIVAGLKAMVGAAREHGLLAAPTPAN